MPERLRKAYHEARFRRVARGVLATPPLRLRPSRLMFLSLTCHRDVHPFLLAMKSVYRSFGEGRVCVLDDGSLTAGDRATIAAHLLDVEFVDAGAVKISGTPSYIVWRRLAWLLELVKEHYVVQVDSDVLATGSIPEAVSAARANKPFILTNRRHPGVVTFAEMSDWIAARSWSAETLQTRVEHGLKDFARAGERRYVRGSAGFAGWPKGAASIAGARAFSDEALEHVGESWLGWGSEQITTNVLLANAPGLVMLGAPDYINNLPNLDPAAARLIHFFGSFRYHDARYATAARKVIAELKAF